MAQYLTEYHRQNSLKAMEYLKNQGPVDVQKEVERHKLMHEEYNKQQKDKQGR